MKPELKPATSGNWRVGRKLGRTLYRDDICVGMVDNPELAAEIVEAMNRRASRTAPATGAAPGKGR